MQLKESVDLQGRQIQLQADGFQLEHRPYLYLHLPLDQIRVWQNETEGGWFGGGDLRFRNVGKDPASITKAQYMVASDARGVIDFVGWFETEFGGFPDIEVVFPGQDDARVPTHPLKPDHDWDRNTKSEAPELKEPKWKEYPSKGYIKRLTQGIGD